jgi:hypothetical protein
VKSGQPERVRPKLAVTGRVDEEERRSCRSRSWMSAARRLHRSNATGDLYQGSIVALTMEPVDRTLLLVKGAIIPGSQRACSG